MSEKPQRPVSDDDREGWKTYWAAQGMAWRAEPEIDEERQRYLAERRAVKPDIEKGIYPFRDESGGIKLARADVEWLLATHENGGIRGPVDWARAGLARREGLDLRAADLRRANLRGLPLSRTRCGLSWGERQSATSTDSPIVASAGLDGADLRDAHLEWAELSGANLERADLREAHLERADLERAYLGGANLGTAHLEGTWCISANFSGKPARMNPSGPATNGTSMPAPPPADLRGVFFNEATNLEEAALGTADAGSAQLSDVHWGGVNLAVIDWGAIRTLGDEQEASRRKALSGEKKTRKARLGNCESAVRANRQLATALRAQGLSEQASRFTYRAQVLERRVLRLRHHYLRALGSWFLDFIAGYGYRPLRAFITYLVVVGAFAGVYALLAHFGLTAERFGSWDSPLVLSVTSFHGRVFFAGGLPLTDWAARVGAVEAAIGLLVEIIFIATFTQRFFAR